jgi:Zn-dependent protease
MISEPILFIRVILIVIISISLHELAHGFVALSQGDDTPLKSGHLTLNPIVHMGWSSIIFLCLVGISWGSMPIKASKFRYPRLSDILVSAAGPLVNLLLGFLCLIIIKPIAAHNLQEIISIKFFTLAAHINFSLFLLNLLPIPPLDGFHVYSQIFPVLKRLEETQFGIFALMLLFIIPEFNDSLNAGVSFMIEKTLIILAIS